MIGTEDRRLILDALDAGATVAETLAELEGLGKKITAEDVAELLADERQNTTPGQHQGDEELIPLVTQADIEAIKAEFEGEGIEQVKNIVSEVQINQAAIVLCLQRAFIEGKTTRFAIDEINKLKYIQQIAK